MEITELEDLAKEFDWQYLTFQENIGMLSFIKDDMRINIYTTKMTVATCLNHPKQGKTQMFRKNVTPDEMKKIFKNPRHHINKGYRKK
jgi:hypothetical protein